jgi:two-component system, NtrC family, response regulator AtoC
MGPKVLFIDDEELILKFLGAAASEWGYEVRTAGTVNKAIDALRAETFDVIVTDVNMPPGGDDKIGVLIRSGLDLIPVCRRLNPGAVILVLTGHGTIEDAVTSIRWGASDYLMKPISPRDLTAALAAAAEEARERGEKAPGSAQSAAPRPVAKRATRTSLVGDSPAMRRVIADLARVAEAEALPVLLTGETGTGKELVARAIHDNGTHASGPFVAINCAAIPADLLESELFGYEKGAFSGAQGARKGYFEQANGGTLMLDEIGDLPFHLQPKLLRVLEDRRIQKLGSSGPGVKFDARVIAATSQNLESLIEDRKFRADLYYRLADVVINLPSLRERREDIPALAQSFLARFAAEKGTSPRRVAPDVWQVLSSYRWPGNVRQLERAMRRAFIFSEDDGEIGLHHLPEDVRAGAPGGVSTPLADSQRAASIFGR